MAHFMKARTLVNPGKKKVSMKAKKKRKLSPLQKLFFGSKRQRAAVAKKQKNPTPRVVIKRNVLKKKAFKKIDSYFVKKRKRRVINKNPSRILTISLPKISNPGNKKKGNTQMVRRKKYHRRKKVSNPVAKVTRRNRRYTRRHVARRNPVYRKHTRRVYHRRHRRNPSRASVMGGFGKFGGMLGGAAVTHVVTGMLPVTLTSGFIGYVTTALVAVLQGKVIGGVLRKPALGKAMTNGGFFYLGLKVLADFFPSVGQYIPFGLKGMGIIGPSSFYVPQVNQPGSMATFIPPAGLPLAVPVAAGMKGIAGNTFAAGGRRTGRLR